MATKTTFAVSTPTGKPMHVEAHTSRKLKRLIVTRISSASRRTITHRKSGHSLASVLPLGMTTIPQFIAFAEALEAMEHRAWEIMDGLTFGSAWDIKKLSGRDRDTLLDFASRARAIGIKIVESGAQCLQRSRVTERAQ